MKIMKTNRKIFIGMMIIILIVASFFIGCYITEQKHNDARLERCNTLILFAIDKAENGDLEEQDTMNALISNIYAAYQFCGDTEPANQLHDLWNYLIFEDNTCADDIKDIVLIELNDVLRSIKTTDK